MVRECDLRIVSCFSLDLVIVLIILKKGKVLCTTETERKDVENTRGKPFKPGNYSSPKGSLNRVTLVIQPLLDGEGEKLNLENY